MAYQDQSKLTARPHNEIINRQTGQKTPLNLFKPLSVLPTQNGMKKIDHSSFSISRKGNKPKVEYNDLPRYNATLI